jgi:riboflavin synthase
MFTGIIRDCGTVKSAEKAGDLLKLQIETSLPAKHFDRGASVAVDGVCLTVESFESGVVGLSAVQETLDRTNLGFYKEGEKINLEPPLTLQDAVSGHLVLGHVDFVAKVLRIAPDLKISIPDEFARFIPEKGSVTINGVSLTVAEVLDGAIRIAIIPETMRATNLGDLKEGWHVNVEIDMIVRYLDQLQS